MKLVKEQLKKEIKASLAYDCESIEYTTPFSEEQKLRLNKDADRITNIAFFFFQKK